MKQWWHTAKVPYLLVVGLLGLVAAASGHRFLGPAWALLVLLAIASLKLDAEVRADRARDGHGYAWARVVFGFGSLAVGLALAVWGGAFFARGADVLFFGGVWLTFLAAGALVSELRLLSAPAAGQRTSRPGSRGPLLLAFALLLALGALTLPPTGGFLVVVALALLIGELGTEVLSEDSHHWGPGDDTAVARRYRHGGVALVATATGLYLAAGVGFNHVLLLLAVIAVLVWVASVDNDALALMLVGVFSLLWASSPKGVDLDAARQPVPEEPYFVVLGDSYISGEGGTEYITGTNTATEDTAEHVNTCRQAITAWPFVLAGRANSQPGLSHVPSRVLFLGCSGAVTENLHTEPRASGTKVHGPAELAQLVDRRAEGDLGRPEFVVVSVGGNDAGFGDIGAACVGPGDCTEIGQQFLGDERRHAADQPVTGPPGAGRAESLSYISDDLDAAFDRIEAVLDDVVDETGGEPIPVIVIPYPVPVKDTGPCKAVLLDGDERVFVNQFVRELNATNKAAAARHGFLFMDTMQDALVSQGIPLCGSSGGSAGLNFIGLNPQGGSIRQRMDPSSWKHNSLHPNDTGHAAMATAAETWFKKHTDLEPLTPEPNAANEVPDLDTLMGRRVQHCELEPECDVAKSRWALREVKSMYVRAFLPSALAMVGVWLWFAPIVWRGRVRGLSTVSILAKLSPRLGRWLGVPDGRDAADR